MFYNTSKMQLQRRIFMEIFTPHLYKCAQKVEENDWTFEPDHPGNTEREKYILAAAIRVSIFLQMTDDKCYLIYLTFSSLMEMQVTMSQRTTSHQWGHQTKVERRRAIRPTSLCFFKTLTSPLRSPEKALLFIPEQCLRITLTLPCGPPLVNYRPHCASVPLSHQAWLEDLITTCVWEQSMPCWLGAEEHQHASTNGFKWLSLNCKGLGIGQSQRAAVFLLEGGACSSHS